MDFRPKTRKPEGREREGWNLVAGLAVILAGSLWLAGFMDRVAMPLIAGSGVEVQTPDVRFYSFDRADSICRAARLELVRSRSRPDGRYAPNTVLDQFPPAGASVKPGRRIEATVADPAGLIAAPTLIGRSIREAKIAADSCGMRFREEAVRYGYSSSDPPGVIIAQDPPPNTAQLHGAELHATVSLGAEPALLIVPDLTGLAIEQVRFELARYQLYPGEVSTFPERIRPPGSVLDQRPKPGSAPPESRTVDVTIVVAPLDASTDTTRNPDSIGVGTPR